MPHVTTPPYASPPTSSPMLDGSSPAKPPIKVWDLVLTILLLLGVAALAAFVSFSAVFLVMASDSCGVRDCSTELIVFGWLLGMGLPWIVLIAAIVVSIVRLVRRRIAFWVPLAGAVLVVLSLVLAFAITAWAVPMS